MKYTFIKEKYRPMKLFDVQRAIKLIKQTFQTKLAKSLKLKRVTAPLFVTRESGLNDDLTGKERKVEFDILQDGQQIQIVQSLAKWKRIALHRYDFWEGTGLYTDMNAIRRDEELDELHSIYVDQWDWEKVITREDRTKEYLKSTVKRIATAIKETIDVVRPKFPTIVPKFTDEVFFITSQELLDLYPTLTTKQREYEITKKHKTVFIMEIGYPLTDGIDDAGRAPDYDDWKLNGDLLVYHEVLDCAMELTSMGIRVDSETLQKQLIFSGKEDRLEFDYHKQIIADKLPLTIGGGIGQSRLCMFILSRGHVGEVQASYWDRTSRTIAKEKGLKLL